MNLDSAVIKVLEQFDNASIDAYLVGGYVRDLLLDKKSFDVDICFNGNIDLIVDLFKEYEPDVSALKYHSISFSIGELNFECTHLRVEGPSQNHRHPSTIELTNDLYEDLKRRDFTINAICYHLHNGIMDPYKGLVDLEKKQLKTIIEAKACFNEDYLRMFRGIRFQSQLGFEFERNTKNALVHMFPRAKGYPVVWWEKEFIKTLKGPYFLKMALENPGFFEVLFGQFQKAFQFDQRNPYHQYSLYEHTMRVVSNIQEDTCLKLAALFHDLGKLSTEVHDAQGISHYRGHAEVSAELARPIIDQFTLKKKEKERVIKVIRYHGIQMKPGFENVYEMAYELGYDLLMDIIEIKRADNLSKSSKAYYQVEKCYQFSIDMKKIKEASWPLVVSDLRVNGNDCLNLHVTHENIGHVLKKVLEMTVKNRVGNDVEKQYQILQEVVQYDLY